jgi:hypothetical protein
MAPTPTATSKERFWHFFTTTTVQGFLLKRVASRSETIETWLNCFFAVTSSASIATWAVWQKYPLVWGGIIAASQVATAIKPFLPYRKLQANTMGLINAFFPILLTVEESWYKICNENLQPEEIDSLLMAHKRDLQRVEAEHFKDSQLPHKPNLLAKAKEDSDEYFKSLEQRP